MARLIDADALMEKLNVFNDRVHGNEHFLYGIETAKELLEDAPTVTEAEIRAKAIDEFCSEAIKQFAEFDRLHGYPTVADCEDVLNDVAEQLKEEA